MAGAVGASGEHDGVMADHQGCETRHGVTDEVAHHGGTASGTDGLGLLRIAVHSGDLVAAFGQQCGQALPHTASGTDLEDLHDGSCSRDCFQGSCQRASAARFAAVLDPGGAV